MLELQRHPLTPCEAVLRIRVRLQREGSSGLKLEYSMELTGRALAPYGAQGGRRDGLWHHTCCEAFLADATGRGYRELNFSPSGAWAAYRFDDYRSGMTPAQLDPEPRIHVSHSPARLALRASVALAGLAPAPQARFALAAVIEEAGGRLSYWSAYPAPGKPDFHHPDGFRIEI